MKKVSDLLLGVDRLIDRLATVGLMLALAGMIVLSCANMILRWWSTTILWAEPLVRHLVFLSAFLGGTVATGTKSHISIDILSRVLEQLGWKATQRYLERVIFVFCLVTLVWLIHASWGLVQMELKFGEVKFLGIHSAYLVGIIPCGLGLIAYRFFVLLILTFREPADSREC